MACKPIGRAWAGDPTQIHAPARNKPFRAGASHFCKPKMLLSYSPSNQTGLTKPPPLPHSLQPPPFLPLDIPSHLPPDTPSRDGADYTPSPLHTGPCGPGGCLCAESGIQRAGRQGADGLMVPRIHGTGHLRQDRGRKGLVEQHVEEPDALREQGAMTRKKKEIKANVSQTMEKRGRLGRTLAAIGLEVSGSTRRYGFKLAGLGTHRRDVALAMADVAPDRPGTHGGEVPARAACIYTLLAARIRAIEAGGNKREWQRKGEKAINRGGEECNSIIDEVDLRESTAVPNPAITVRILSLVNVRSNLVAFVKVLRAGVHTGGITLHLPFAASHGSQFQCRGLISNSYLNRVSAISGDSFDCLSNTRISAQDTDS
ncbi:hypothetical protein C8R44DRAFT_747075 [Mycena epipterygia]|nr:hypothetical protein C8R44DRAFT_747075 [Mycena epipterygia]